MTHFVSTVRAYDVLGAVHISGHVIDADADRDGPDHEFHTACTVSGTGESDHRKWLRDALVALAETL